MSAIVLPLVTTTASFSFLFLFFASIFFLLIYSSAQKTNQFHDNHIEHKLRSRFNWILFGSNNCFAFKNPWKKSSSPAWSKFIHAHKNTVCVRAKIKCDCQIEAQAEAWKPKRKKEKKKCWTSTNLLVNALHLHVWHLGKRSNGLKLVAHGACGAVWRAQRPQAWHDWNDISVACVPVCMCVWVSVCVCVCTVYAREIVQNVCPTHPFVQSQTKRTRSVTKTHTSPAYRQVWIIQCRVRIWP